MGALSMHCTGDVHQDNYVPIEARANMAFTHGLQHEHKDLFERVPHSMSVLTRVSRERFSALERLAVRVDKLERDVKR